MSKPEEIARRQIDTALAAAGWAVQDYKAIDLTDGRGQAVREFPGARGPADYLLYADQRAIGIVEAKAAGHTLKGVEGQSAGYSESLPAGLPAWARPLPFQYESTGAVTQFTDWREPDARSRVVFSFHRPETLVEMVKAEKPLRAWLREMPPLPADGLWPKQHTAIGNLERSLAHGRPKALIQMATGSGKTFTAANIAYRLAKFGHARRVCFLVDRTNLGLQTLKEFQNFQPPGEGHTFDKLYPTDFPRVSRFDPVNKVVITTIQRLYSVLTGNAFAEEDEEQSTFERGPAFKKPPLPITYNRDIPPEFFDAIIVDECHRSIYSVWGDVLKYFDAFLVGLTATPGKQTIGFFDKHLVMQYTHEEAVADRVNVPFDVYRIETRISTSQTTVESGYTVGKRSRKTRRERMEALDDDLTYDPEDLDRAVVAKDQIRTIVQTFRDRLFTEIFPGRRVVPKTIIFAKDDSHADDIVDIVREEFGKGNDFCQKITYRTGMLRTIQEVIGEDGTPRKVPVYTRTGGKTGEEVLQVFRNSYEPRIAVTVDMIATGTDVKPVEIVFFMRGVRSSNYFEQMKGRGVRVMNPDQLKGVTPDARSKTRFVIVDAVGVCEQAKREPRPIDRQPSKSLDQVLQFIAAGGTDPDAVSALAGKLAKLSLDMTEDQHAEVESVAGTPLSTLVANLEHALDADAAHTHAAAALPPGTEPDEKALEAAEQELIREAVRPWLKPALRQTVLDIKHSAEQIIDFGTIDELIAAGFSDAAYDAARQTVTDFERFIGEHQDELTALQAFYAVPATQRASLRDLKDLAKALQRPPLSTTPEQVWRCYELLENRPSPDSGPRVATDLVSLLRHTLRPEEPLTPFPRVVAERYERWHAQQAAVGVVFTADQRRWLDLIAEHIGTSLTIEMDDLQHGRFHQMGSLGKAHEVFGSGLGDMLAELNEVLAQ
ncbi:MAG: DEAD/DEAH box helicase family protein [Phycisphaerales bacterium]|nr:DEAD/DEAH box helicase family protein [Phycisphaerales bacterium]